MRKFKLFAIVALMAATTMMLSSCFKETLIVGKWKVSHISSDMNTFDYDEGQTWTFKDNGSCTIFLMGVEIDGEWDISKGTLYIDLDKFYAKDYNEIKIDGEFDIDELNSSEMELSGKWIGKVDGGESESIKVDYRFKKK